MENAAEANPSTSGHNLDKQQDGDKTRPRRIRARNAEGTAAYWKSKLFRNSYRDRNGRTVEQPEWYCRLRFGGTTRRVRLKSGDKDRAAEQAVDLAASLAKEGWIAVERGMARLPSSLSIEEFCEVYGKAADMIEKNPPRPVSKALYTQRLRQVCALAQVKQFRELTPSAVEKAKDAYLAKGRKAKRDQVALNNSLAATMRNAGACFSKKVRPYLGKLGLKIESNPFEGVAKGDDIQEVQLLDRGVVDRIWRDLPLLRDGDPNASAPAGGAPRVAGRTPYDWRQSNPKAWAAILLAISTGLRANEIDKARWSWFEWDKERSCFLIIRKEKDFVAKGGRSRKLLVPQELYNELIKIRVDLASPYILGGTSSDAVAKAGYGYRQHDVFRMTSAWLRARGINGTNPLHTLRREFGSQVATTYGLFAAQKLLGHKSPDITSKYYANLINLPKLTHLRIVS